MDQQRQEAQEAQEKTEEKLWTPSRNRLPMPLDQAEIETLNSLGIKMGEQKDSQNLCAVELPSSVLLLDTTMKQETWSGKLVVVEDGTQEDQKDTAWRWLADMKYENASYLIEIMEKPIYLSPADWTQHCDRWYYKFADREERKKEYLTLFHAVIKELCLDPLKCKTDWYDEEQEPTLLQKFLELQKEGVEVSSPDMITQLRSNLNNSIYCKPLFL